MQHLRDIELIELASETASPDASIREHLATCADCRRRLDEFRTVHAVLGSWRDDTAPTDLWPAISARLDNPSPRLKPARNARVLLVLRAAAAVGIGAWLGHGVEGLWQPAQSATVTEQDVDSILGLDTLESPSATGLGAIFTPVDSYDQEVRP